MRFLIRSANNSWAGKGTESEGSLDVINQLNIMEKKLLPQVEGRSIAISNSVLAVFTGEIPSLSLKRFVKSSPYPADSQLSLHLIQ